MLDYPLAIWWPSTLAVAAILNALESLGDQEFKHLTDEPCHQECNHLTEEALLRALKDFSFEPLPMLFQAQR